MVCTCGTDCDLMNLFLILEFTVVVCCMLYVEGASRNATAAKSVFQAAQKWEMQAPGNEFGYNPYSTSGIARKGGKFNCPKLLTFLFSFWSFGSDACPGLRDLGGGPC